MADHLSPLAGKPAPASLLTNIPRLITAYFSIRPDPAIMAQRVKFGTSGHRGAALEAGFNEAHILAITQAICHYRRQAGIDGPLFLGMDTHALSEPAFANTLEVLTANGVETMIDSAGHYTPTPAISHAILAYNHQRKAGWADGIVITPSHNPPDQGGFKYNPPNGGPADTDVTGWIERAANEILRNDLQGVARLSYARARKAACVHGHDYVSAYVRDLVHIVDMDVIRDADINIGIDPLGGAAAQYWQTLIEHYRLRARVVNTAIDPTFRFMTVDWDGQIRMDCSSAPAMAGLIALRHDFDIAFANDTDADRHGIVCPSAGLMNPNTFLAAAIAYLCQHRPGWSAATCIGKTVVSSAMIDRVAGKLGRRLYEVPVGFKWFSAGLLDGSLAFGGEESAGASYLRRDGSVWTTDKDGPIMGLLAAEICARTGKDPAQFYGEVTKDLGVSHYARIDAPANAAQRAVLGKLDAAQFPAVELAGDPVEARLTQAPGNGAAIGGLKIITRNGWFAARPSGTEDTYKIYAESFVSAAHLARIQEEAQAGISAVLKQA